MLTRLLLGPILLTSLFCSPEAHSRPPLVAESWKLAYPEAQVQTVTPARVQVLQDAIEPISQRCLAHLEDRLGKKWPRRRDGTPKRLSIKLERDQELFEGAAETSGMFFIAIKLKVLPFLNGTTNVEKTLCHEMVHAYFRYHMNYFAYGKVPRWLREGSAVYLAGQTFEKEKNYMLKNARHKEHFNGLEGEHSFEDYYEDALAFHAMDERSAGSASNADQYLRLILQGRSPEQATRQLWQMEKAVFLSESLQFARQHVTDKLDKEVNPAWYAVEQSPAPVAFAFYRRELKARGILLENPASLSTSLEEHKRDLYVNLLLQSLIKSIVFRQQGELGIEILKALLQQGETGYLSSIRSEMRYQLANLYAQQGNWALALEQHWYYFHEHFESPIVQRLIPLAIAESYFHLQDWGNVLAWAKDREHFHESNREELAFYRAVAYFHRDDLKRTRRTLTQLLGQEQLSVRLKTQILDFIQTNHIQL